MLDQCAQKVLLTIFLYIELSTEKTKNWLKNNIF